MAVPRFARVTHIEALTPDTRALTLEADEPLGFAGGQYILIDSGLVASSGKAVKRAYSIVSADDDQRTLEFAVKRLPDAPGSGYVHGLAVGDIIRFSGPWGKLATVVAPGPRTLVLATDTGITAAIGLVRGARFASLVPTTRLIWLRTDAGYFVPDAFVQARLPAGLTCEIGILPPPHHPERLAHVRSVVRDELVPGRLHQAFITGDGAINYALVDELVALGVPATRDHVESFFNMPKKASP